MIKRIRRDWRAVRAADFPETGANRERLLFLLRYAVLAPSYRNTQPWKFAVEGDRIAVYADRARWLVASDPVARDLRMSVGCALENLLVAATHFGYEPEVSMLPRQSAPDLVAVVNLARRHPARRRRDYQLDPLLRRRAAGGGNPGPAPSPNTMADLEWACGDEEARLFLTLEPEACRAAGDLFLCASELQLTDVGVRDEVAHWLSAAEYGVARWMVQMGPLAMPGVERHADVEAGNIANTPCFGVIATPWDDAMAQVQAGRALERVWLAAAHHRMALRPASALCAVPEVRSRLEDLMAVPAGLHVQAAFRLANYEANHAQRTRRLSVRKRMAAIAVP